MCDMTLAVPPSGAHTHPYATECMPGFVTLATQQQVLEGTNTTHAVTPATLPRLLAEKVPNASETQRGLVELATLEEALAGTDAERAITPAVLHQMTGSGYLAAVFWLNAATYINAETPLPISVNTLTVHAGDDADFDIVGGLPRSRKPGLYACMFTPTYINATGAFSSSIGSANSARRGAGFVYNGETRWNPIPSAMTIERVEADTIWRGTIYNSQQRQLGTAVSYSLVRLGD